MSFKSTLCLYSAVTSCKKPQKICINFDDTPKPQAKNIKFRKVILEKNSGQTDK